MNPKKALISVLSSVNPTLETKLAYRYSFGKKLDLDNPKNINEKILYLKLNDYNNNQTVTNCIDKYKIREYLESIDECHLLPKLYGVYNNACEIDFDSLPQKFVIKCNHGCGYNIIVTDKDKEDKDQIISQLNQWMDEDYWRLGCEIQYKYIEKKIIIEEFLENLKCYKFFCFNGVPKVLYLSTDVWNNGVFEKDKYIDYYDMNFNRIDCQLKGHPNSNIIPDMPNTFDEMKSIAKRLSKPFPFVRIDLYDCNGKIYISEYTFIPTAGFMHLTPESILDEWGEWLKLK